MRVSSLRRLPGQVLALVGLAIVLPAWVAVTLGHRERRRLVHLSRLLSGLPRLWQPGDARVIGLGVLVVAGWWSLSAAILGIGPPTLAVPLVVAPLFLLAYAMRRSDPVPEYLADLAQHWLSGNGWKCRVLRIGPSPSHAVPLSCTGGGRVYRVYAQDEWGQARIGLIRFGNGRIDFNWDEEPSGRPLELRPEPRHRPALVPARSQPEILAGRDPLWDRWLDG
jgi:hypothetical protein